MIILTQNQTIGIVFTFEAPGLVSFSQMCHNSCFYNSWQKKKGGGETKTKTKKKNL